MPRSARAVGSFVVTDDAPDFAPWTKAGAERLLKAADDLKDAISAHAEALSGMTGTNDEVLFGATERLIPAVLAYADAQGEFTGYWFPFGVIHQYMESEEEETDGEKDPTTEEHSLALSVVQRRDYLVTNAEAVLDAGRQAYLRVWPDDTGAAAAADVTHLGRALYQLAHADGWDNLHRTNGLSPVAGVIAVVKPEEPLGPDPDDWVDEVVEEGVEVIYSQADIFRAT